ncbi:MAG: substrate-binding domain-containing protein [Spirochaetia bacterium]|nr:substrate-binding domain-containing protein [Spirochaetia bacterium]
MRFAFINSRIHFKTVDPRALHFHYHTQVGVAEGVAALGIGCHYYDAGLDLDRFYKEERFREYDGILGLIGWVDGSELPSWREIQKKIPCVNLTVEPREARANFVGVDDAAGMRLILDHLRRENYRKIGYAGFHYQPYALRRFHEFRSAANGRTFETEPAWTFGPATKTPQPLHHLKDGGAAGFRGMELELEERAALFGRLLDSGDLPEVVLCETDYFANEFHRAALKRGLRIPGDLALTGFDGNHILFEGEGYHFLTTAAQDFSEIGRISVRMLHDIVRKKSPPHGRHILFTPRLLVGKSTSRDAKPPTAEDRFRDETAAYLEEHYADERLTEHLGRHFGLSPHYFLVKFKKITGKNFTEVANAYRVDKAAFYLAQTSRSVTDILWETGFRTHQNFNKFFKRRTGLTPSEYRKKRL